MQPFICSKNSCNGGGGADANEFHNIFSGPPVPFKKKQTNKKKAGILTERILTKISNFHEIASNFVYSLKLQFFGNICKESD